jgi:hypothetical protein
LLTGFPGLVKANAGTGNSRGLAEQPLPPGFPQGLADHQAAELEALCHCWQIEKLPELLLNGGVGSSSGWQCSIRTGQLMMQFSTAFYW